MASSPRYVAALAVLAFAAQVSAEVTLTDRAVIQRHQQKLAAKQAQAATHPGRPGGHSVTALATGSQPLIDASGVKYFINTNITFSTSSSASAGMSEASYTHSVSATTLNGGDVQSKLTDAYDGYQTICLVVNHVPATCETGNANFEIYNKNGPASVEGNLRQIDFPVKSFGTLDVSRKVFVPDNDQFARWLNIFTNNDSTPQQVTMVVANNLGSDANTVIVTDSSGNTSPTTADDWVTTFQNYSGTTSSDPRLGHVLQGPGAPVQLAGINFANGDDNPWWGYTFTLQPGQTGIIMNFAVVQPSKAAAATKCAQLVGLPANALQFMNTQEQQEVLNFIAAPTTHFSVSAPGTATAGTQFSFTVTALDAGGGTATGYSGTVKFTSSDAGATLPGNSTLNNGTGTFNATLIHAGNQTITATDAGNSSITGTSNTIVVGAASPSTITATGGTPQGGVPGAPLAAGLRATVRDGFGNPVPGVLVTFTAPGLGPSGAFPGNSLTAMVTTDAGGVAAAPVFRPNGVPGSYDVTATAPGVAGTALFALTNTAAIPAAGTAGLLLLGLLLAAIAIPGLRART